MPQKKRVKREEEEEQEEEEEYEVSYLKGESARGAAAMTDDDEEDEDDESGGNDGGGYFWVRWKGYPDEDSTWEPQQNILAKHVISEFRSKYKLLWTIAATPTAAASVDDGDGGDDVMMWSKLNNDQQQGQLVMTTTKTTQRRQAEAFLATLIDMETGKTSHMTLPQPPSPNCCCCVWLQTSNNQQCAIALFKETAQLTTIKVSQQASTTETKQTMTTVCQLNSRVIAAHANQGHLVAVLSLPLFMACFNLNNTKSPRLCWLQPSSPSPTSSTTMNDNSNVKCFVDATAGIVAVVCCLGDESWIRGFDLADGSLMWARDNINTNKKKTKNSGEQGCEMKDIVCCCLVGGDDDNSSKTMVVVTREGRLFGVSMWTGQEFALGEMRDTPTCCCDAGNGMVVVGCKGGCMTLFDTSSKKVVFQFILPSSVESPSSSEDIQRIECHQQQPPPEQQQQQRGEEGKVIVVVKTKTTMKGIDISTVITQFINKKRDHNTKTATAGGVVVPKSVAAQPGVVAVTVSQFEAETSKLVIITCQEISPQRVVALPAKPHPQLPVALPACLRIPGHVYGLKGSLVRASAAAGDTVDGVSFNSEAGPTEYLISKGDLCHIRPSAI